MINSRYKFQITPALKDFKIFYRDNLFFIKIKENNLLNSRVGVIVSQKNTRLSTGRNAIKRLVYRFFQANKVFLDNFIPPSDFLVIILTDSFNLIEKKRVLIQKLNNAISI